MIYSHDLAKACYEHSKLMAEGKVEYGHSNMMDRVDYYYKKLAMGDWEVYKTEERYNEMRHAAGSFYENVVKTSITTFYNFTTMPEDAVYSWKESSGHDKNLIGPKGDKNKVTAITGTGIYCKPVTDSKFYAY